MLHARTLASNLHAPAIYVFRSLRRPLEVSFVGMLSTVVLLGNRAAIILGVAQEVPEVAHGERWWVRFWTRV